MKQALLVLAALAALAPTAIAQDAQKAIQAQYDKRSAAAAKKDVTGSLAINAPEFVSIGQKKEKRTTAQIKPQLVQVFATFKSYTVTTKITKCTITGDKATVLTQDTIVLVSKDTQETEGTSEDLWIKKEGQWLRTQNTLLTSKLKSKK